MKKVKAPTGYEGGREYVDAAREWRVVVRPAGFNWWTRLDYIGHPQTPDEELDALAEARIRLYAERGF